jgi:hypothetical protein
MVQVNTHFKNIPSRTQRLNYNTITIGHHHQPICRNPSFGLATKARGCKVAGQVGDPGALHMLPGVQIVWGNEPSHSQVNSHVGSCSPERTPEFSERDCRGQISSPRGVLYIIGKLLKCRCLKWARIAHLDIWNTSYGQKKGRESNWQFDSRPLKVGNRLDLLGCRQRVTYRWKALDESYNFASNHIAIEALHKKLCALKVPGEKSHLDVGSMESHRVYYKGEGRAVVSLVCPCCPWLVLAPKVFQLCTNHFVWVVCRPMWVNKLVNSS